MNKKQLTDLVIIPALKEIPKGFSASSVLAIQMIIAHESRRGEYIAQKEGPAIGIIQMEPETYYSTWNYGNSIWDNALKLGIISEHEKHTKRPPKIERLLYDLRYNVFIARQRLFMFTEKLPNNAEDMSHYLKNYWNAGGKATATKYHYDFKIWS